MGEITPQQRHCMLHALGLNKRSETKLIRWAYRNHYQLNAGSEGHEIWKPLVKAGYATVSRFSRDNPAFSGSVYRVTLNGVVALGVMARVPLSLVVLGPQTKEKKDWTKLST